MSISSANPAQFGVSLTHGFLPENPPLCHLSKPFAEWDDFAIQLPKYLAGNRIRELIQALPPFPVEDLATNQEWERAMVVLSYLGHSYVWTDKEPAHSIPPNLALPWHQVAKKLGRPPVLSYASYCLHNWRLLENHRAIENGNIALLQNFYGGIDEEWFILVHVDIEKKAAPLVNAMIPCQSAILCQDTVQVTKELKVIFDSLTQMNTALARMVEFCDPYVYYHRVRPYIHGWKGHPDLPKGLIYEGVEEYKGIPQQFRGETGAQSSIVPALDGLFGVQHQQDILRDYLMEMRDYMPPNFRAFIKHIEEGPSLREFVIHSGHPELIEIYDECLEQMETFRTKHYEFAASYIFKQGQTDAKNPHAVGTGGTPFMPYLKKHRDETRAHIIHS